MKVAVLGSTGMLGHVVKDFLDLNSQITVFGASRDENPKFEHLDATKLSELEKFFISNEFDYVINCIGVIKPKINENISTSVLNAIEVNSLFPHRLLEIIKDSQTKVIQIATDCVFSGGSANSYDEKSQHDPLDVYGKTKSLGEVESPNFLNLRVSIVGREVKTKFSLLEWVLGQPKNSYIKGFQNHMWNGITTLHFAKLIAGIIENDLFVSGTFHIVPDDKLNKFELLKCFAKYFNRGDLHIEAVEAPESINRILTTNYQNFNLQLWKSAGYEKPPKISSMLRELSDWINR